MLFAVIEPAKLSTRCIDTADMTDLYLGIGLRRGMVDHGVVSTGIGIVVGEFSLLIRPELQRYFSIGRRLYGGPAVLYGFDARGNPVDLPRLPLVFFMSIAGIEDAISRGQIDRPVITMNDEQFWEWPQLPPFQLPEHPRG